MFLRTLPVVALLIGMTAVRAEDIVVTQVASATHPVTKLYANGLNVGFNVFFAGINAKGGIHGKKVILSVKDDHYNPDETVALVKESIQDPKTIALFGTVGTGNLGALVKTKMLQDNNIALMAPASGIPAQLAAPNVFPIRASYTDQLVKVAKHAGTLNRQRVAFMYIDSPLAPDLKKAIETGLEEAGKKLAGSVKIDTTPDNAQMDKNVRKAVEQAQASQPDTYVIFGPGSVTPSAIKAIREKHGQSVMIYALITPPPAALIATIGLENASGLIVPQLVPLPSDNRLQIVKEYLTDLAKYAPTEKPSGLTLEGYLGARVLYEGLKKAGPNPTRAALTSALNDLGKVNVNDFQVDYSPGRKSGYKAVEMTMINKGGTLIH
jgi:branched-chain amino acid transport system substrate-binding protein